MTNDVEVPLDASISLTFSQKVNKNSAEENFYIIPNVTGDFSWEGNTLTFDPVEEFTRGQSVEFGLRKGVRAKNLLRTRHDLSYTFTVLSNLKVAMASPQGNVSKEVDKIYVLFDRSVIIPDDPDIFNITPSVEGEKKWIGSAAYMIKPDNLVEGQKYTIDITQDLSSTDGGYLEKGYSFEFTNFVPTALHVEAAGVSSTSADNKNPNGPITIYFNQPVDPNTVISNLSIRETILGNPVGYRPVFESRSSEDNRTYYYNPWEMLWEQKVMLYPTSTLKPDTTYTIQLTPGFKSLAGNAVAEAGITLTMTTAKLPGYLGSSIQDGARNVGQEKQLEILFQSPMSQDELESKMVITPSLSESERAYFLSVYQGNTKVRYINALKRSTNYEFFIPADTKDAYGRPLNEDVTITFKTAPYNPSVSLYPYNTYFGTFSDDVDTRFISRVVNVDSLEYTIFKLTVDQYVALRQLNYSEWGNLNSTVAETLGFEKVLTYSMPLDLELDIHTDVLLNINEDAAFDLEAGFYLIDVSIPETSDHDNMAFVVGDVGVTAKVSHDNLLIWTTDLNDQAVKEDYSVDIYTYGRNDIKNVNNLNKFTLKSPYLTGKTNSDGVYMSDHNSLITDSRNAYVVIVKKDNDVGVLFDGWNSGISPYQFDQVNYSYNLYSNGPKQYEAYVLTDRNLYRPGDDIRYSIYIRHNDLHTYSIPNNEVPVSLYISELYDYTGKRIYEEKFSDVSLGYAEGTYTIPEGLSLGRYTINVSVDNETIYSTYFDIQEYVVPEFEVTTVVPQNEVKRGDTVNLSAEAVYFSGSPLINNDVDYRLYKRNYVYRWDEDPRYTFYSTLKYYEDDDIWRGFEETEVFERSGKTNTVGRTETSHYLNSDPGISEIYTFEADVLSESGRKLSGSNEFVMHMANHYTGIRNDSYFGNVDDPETFYVKTINPSNVNALGIDVEYEVYRREYFRVKSKENSGDFYYETTYEDTLVDSGGVTTDSNGEAAFEFTPKNGGVHIIVVSSYDSKGNLSTADKRFYVGSYGSSAYWKRESHDRVDLIAEKEEYTPGETAKFIATSTLENTVGLLTVEAERILDYKIFMQNSSGDAFDVEVKDTYVPNVYISSLLVSAGKSVFEPAEFRMGITNISVNKKEKLLNVEIDTDKDTYSPKESGKATIIVTDKHGNKLENARITLALVDDAVITMSPIKRSNIFEHFYAGRPWAIQTFHSLTMSLDRINANTEIGAKGGSGSKGGAGGDYVDLSREDFSETAHWVGTVTTDNEGRAEIEFKLPDSTTRWNLFALARNSNGDKFGQNVYKFGSTLEYFIRPALPRFLRVGDTFDLAGVIQNNSRDDISATLEISVEGIKIPDSVLLKQEYVNSMDVEKIAFNAVAGEEGTAKVSYKLLVSDKVVDIVNLEIPILPYGVEEFTSRSNSVEYSAVEQFKLDPSANKDHGELTVDVYGSYVGIADQSVNDLSLGYQSSCTHHVATGALARIFKYSYYKQIQGETDTLLENKIKNDIQRLLSSRKGDGSWGYCPRSLSGDIASTSFALEVLLEAEYAGFDVDLEITNSAVNYIQSQLTINQGDYDSLSYYAYLLELGKSDQSGRLENLYNRRGSLSDFGKAYLIMAMKESSHNWNKYIDQLYSELANNADLASQRMFWNIPRGVWWCNDDIYTTSVVLRALNSLNANSPLSALATRYLVNNNKEYLSRQSLSTKAVALYENAIVSGIKSRNTEVEIYLNNELKTQGEFLKKELYPKLSTSMPINELLDGENTSEVKLTKGGNGYYSMVLRTLMPFENVASFSNEIALEREFYDMDGNEITDSQFKVGETYAVRLTIASPNTRRHLTLEDYLPAGFESVNNSLTNESGLLLENAEQEMREQGNERNLWLSDVQMRDSRTDMYVRFIGQGLYEYTYLVKAYVPGKFKLKPAQIYEIYSPDVRAHTNGNIISIVE